MSKPIRLLIVDDHPPLRAGLVAMLSAYEGRFQVVAEAGNAEEAFSKASQLAPDVVLTDFDLGKGQTTGAELICQLRQSVPGIRHMLISAHTDDEYLMLAHDAGASAFLEKNTGALELSRAIEAVAAGFTQYPEQLRTALIKRESEPKLTERELELVPYVARGLRPKSIAQELNRLKTDTISYRTVEAHLLNIKRKFHLGPSTTLTSFAIDYCQSHRIPYKSAKSKN